MTKNPLLNPELNLKTVKFQRNEKDDFNSVVRKRVRAYFQDNDISQYGNANMVFKTIFMLSVYWVPYVLMITGVVENTWLILLMYVFMGLGTCGIGLTIMHDGNHGAYSKNPAVNKLMGFMLTIIGGSASNWRVQHNLLHHTYTNIDQMDEDISRVEILRFNPWAERKKMHRFQHIYAWFLYGLMTVGWPVSDVPQFIRYYKKGYMKEEKNFGWALTKMLFWKGMWAVYMLVLPMILLPVPWWSILLFILASQFIAGLTMATIFQAGHVMEENEYPLPDNVGMIESKWAEHQLRTTSNFANQKRWVTWLMGGLNHQIEHHLFPTICHVHYPEISKIVKQTAEEFDLPYTAHPSFLAAIFQHGKMLRALGNIDVPELKQAA